MAGHGFEFTGLRETAAALKKLGVTDDAIKDAMQEAGAIVQRETWRIMPVDTGAMAKSLKVNRSKNLLKITVGNNTTVPYAYTFHAIAKGVSKGAFVFRVPTHSRRGHQVRGYVAARRIQDRASLYLAWERTQQQVIEAYVTAMGRLFEEFARG